MVDIVNDYADVGRLLTYPGPNVRFPVCTFTTVLGAGLTPPTLQVIVSAPDDAAKVAIADITVIIDAVHSPADSIYDANKNVFRVWLKVSSRLFDSQRTFDFVLHALDGAGAYQRLGQSFLLSKELKFIGDVTDHVAATVSDDMDGVYSLKFYPEKDIASDGGYIKVGSMYVFGGTPNSDELPYAVTVMEDDSDETIAEGVKIEQESGANDTTRLTIYYKPTGTQTSRNGSRNSQVYVTVRDKALRTICRQFKLLPMALPTFDFQYVDSAYGDSDGVPGFLKEGFAGAIATLTADSLPSTGFTPVITESTYFILNGMFYAKDSWLDSSTDKKTRKVAVTYAENGRIFNYFQDIEYYIFDAIGASSTDVSLANYKIDSIFYPDYDTNTLEGYCLLANITVDDSVSADHISVQVYSADMQRLLPDELIVTKVGSLLQILISKDAITTARTLNFGKMYYVGIYDNVFVQAPIMAPASAAETTLPARTLFYAFSVVSLANPALVFDYANSAYTDGQYPGFYSVGFSGAVGTFTIVDPVDLSAAFSLADVSNIYSISSGVLALKGDALLSTGDVQLTVPENTVHFLENGRTFAYETDLHYYMFDAIGASSADVSLANYKIDSICYPDYDEEVMEGFFLLANITVGDSVSADHISAQVYSANMQKLLLDEFRVSKIGSSLQILASKAAMTTARTLTGGKMYYVGIYDNLFVQAPLTAPASAAETTQPARTFFHAFNVIAVANPALTFEYANSGYTDGQYPGFYSVGFDGALGTFTIADPVDLSAAFSSNVYNISSGQLVLTGDALLSTNDLQQTVPGNTVHFSENGRTFSYEADLHYYIFDAIAASSADVSLLNYKIDSICYPNKDEEVMEGFFLLANITVGDSVSADHISAQVYSANMQKLLLDEFRVSKIGSSLQILASKAAMTTARTLTGGKMYYVGIYDNLFVQAPLTAPASAAETTQPARTFFHAFNVIAVANPALTFDYASSGYTDGQYPGFYSVGFGGALGKFTIADPVDIDSVFSLANASSIYAIFNGTFSLTGDARLSKGDVQQTVAEHTVQITEYGRIFAYETDLHYYIFDKMAVLTALDVNTGASLNIYALELQTMIYPDHDMAIDNSIPFLSISINETVDASKLAVQFYDLNNAQTDTLSSKVHCVQDGLTLRFELLVTSVQTYRTWNSDHAKNIFIYDSLLVTPPEIFTDCRAGPRSAMHKLTLPVFANPIFDFAAVAVPDSHSVEGHSGYLWDRKDAAIDLYALSINTLIPSVSNVFSFADASLASSFKIGSNAHLTIQDFDTADIITLPANTLQVSENGRQFAYATPINVYAYEALEVGSVTNVANIEATVELLAAADGSYALYYYPSVDKTDENVLVLGSVVTSENAGSLSTSIDAQFAANVSGTASAYFTRPFNPSDSLSVGDRDGSVTAEVVFYLYDSRFLFTQGIPNGRTVSVTFKLYPIAAPQVQFTWREADGKDSDDVRGYIAEDNSSDIWLGIVAVSPLSGSLPETEVVLTMAAEEKYNIIGDVSTSPAKVYARSGQYAPSSDESTSLIGTVLSNPGILVAFVVTENGRTFYSDGRSQEHDSFYLFKDLQVRAEYENGVFNVEEMDFYSLLNPVTLQYGLGMYTVGVTVVPIVPSDTYAHKKQVFRNITFDEELSQYSGSNNSSYIHAYNFLLDAPLGEPVDAVTQFASFLHTNTITANFNNAKKIVSETLQVWNNFEQTLLQDGHVINIHAGANRHIPYSFFALGGIMADDIGIVTFTSSLPLLYNIQTLALDYFLVLSSPLTYDNVTFTIGLGGKQAIISGVTVHFYLDMVLTLPIKTLQFVKCIDNGENFRNSDDKVYNYGNTYTVGKHEDLGLPDAPSIYYSAGHPSDAFGTPPTVTLTKLNQGEYDATEDATLEWIAGIDYNTRQLIITNASLDPYSTYRVQLSSSSVHNPFGEWVVFGDVPLNTVTSLTSDANTSFLFELVDPKFEIKPTTALLFDPSKAMVNFAPNASTIDYSPKVNDSNDVDLNGGKFGRAPLLYNAFRVLVHNPDGIFALSQFKHNVRIGFVDVYSLDGVTYDNVNERATDDLMFVRSDAKTYTGFIEVQVTTEHAYLIDGEDMASIVGIVAQQTYIPYGKYKLVILSKSGSDLTTAANGHIYDYTMLNNDSIGFVFDTILWTTANVKTAKLERQEDLSLQWPDHLLLQFNSLALYSFSVDGVPSSAEVHLDDPSPVFTFELQARNGSNDFATLCTGSGYTYANVQNQIAALVLPERMIVLDVNGNMPSWVSPELWLEYRVRIENDALGQDLQDIAHYLVGDRRHQIYTKGQFTDFRVPGSEVTVRETLRDNKYLLETIRVKSEVFGLGGMETYIFNPIETVPVTAAVEAALLSRRIKDASLGINATGYFEDFILCNGATWIAESSILRTNGSDGLAMTDSRYSGGCTVSATVTAYKNGYYIGISEDPIHPLQVPTESHMSFMLYQNGSTLTYYRNGRSTAVNHDYNGIPEGNITFSISYYLNSGYWYVSFYMNGTELTAMKLRVSPNLTFRGVWASVGNQDISNLTFSNTSLPLL